MNRILVAALMALSFSLPAHAGIAVQALGGLGRGKGVDLYTLTNAKGMEARITNYGAAITGIKVADRDGKPTDVVQGFDSLADNISLGSASHYGALLGRYAGRIKNNSFMLDDANYRISRDAYMNSQAENTPYDEQVWSASTQDGDEPQLILSIVDRKGAMGFPGILHVQVTYTLTRDNILRIDYRARSDADTVLSLTNHTFFNLAGDASGPVLDQLLTVNANAIAVSDAANIPTGAMRPVAGTAFDFRFPTLIGKNINAPDPAIRQARGFDQTYALNGKPGTLRLAARLQDPKSGRVMEEWTTQDSLQLVTANPPLPVPASAKGYDIHGAVALDAQAFPNAPNIATFPSAALRRDTIYTQTTEYRFSVAP